MTEVDPLFARLAELPLEEPSPQLSALLRERAQVRLRPRSLSLVWTVAITASVAVYLGWALRFASQLY